MSMLGLRATLGPLEYAYLPLRPGMTVLYGKNGAGKSTILESLRIATSGLWEERSAHDGRIALFYQDDDLERLQGLYEEERGLSRNAYGGWGGYYRDLRNSSYTEPQEFRRKLREEVATIWASHLQERLPLAALAREVVDQGILAFMPVGVSEPTWEVWLCSQPTETTSAVNSILRAIADKAVQLAPVLHRLGSETGDESDSTFDEAMELRGDTPLYLGLLGAHGFLRYGNHEALPKDRHLAPLTAFAASDLMLDSEAAPSLASGDLLGFDGGPVPVVRLGTITRSPFASLPEATLEQAAEDTRAAASRYAGSHDDETWLGGLDAWAARISEAANAFYRAILLDSPTLELSVPDPRTWLASAPISWRADGRPLSELSNAEQKWAAFAIILTIRGRDYPEHIEALRPGQPLNTRWRPIPSLMLLDEPEASLHRSAEEHMARGLTRVIGQVTGAVVATHCPALLDNPDTHVLRVHRNHGGAPARISRLEPQDLRDLEGLGMVPSDLLRRWRAILLVEGHHEAIIFDELMGKELHEARVHVLPIGGVGQLHATVDSRLLWDFTDAVVIPVVDNEKEDRLNRVWEQAMVLDATEGTGPAVDFIGRNLTKKEGFETKAMSQFLSLAIAKGRPTYSRIQPFAFRKPDITDYLPIELLLPEEPDNTWDGLRAEQARQTGPGQKVGAFKPWLQKWYGKKHGRTIFTDEAIRKSARRMTMPHEFQLLLNRCRTAGPPLEQD